MEHWPYWFRERRSGANGLIRGKRPEVSLPTRGSIRAAIGGHLFMAATIGFLAWVVLSLLHVTEAGTLAAELFVLTLAVLCLMPFLIVFGFWRFHSSSLPVWRKFSGGQRWVACAALAGLLTAIVNDFTLPVRHWLVSGTWRSITLPPLPAEQLFTVKSDLGVWLLVTIALFVIMHYGSRAKSDRVKPFRPGKLTTPLPFCLWLGESSGHLATLWHSANMARGQQIVLSLEDAAQNILVLGAIGSGKTTRAMHGLLIQLLDQDCGGLIFDIKGDFKKAVMTFAGQTRREPVIIGVGQPPLNLLSGLTPELSASFLKSALLLGGGGKNDSFWIDTATELCRNVLGVLIFVPEHYHLNGLYRYLFDKEFKTGVHQELQLSPLDAAQQRRLDVCRHYIDAIFGNFDDKVKTGVLASVAQILSPFQHPDLVDAFCAPVDAPAASQRMEAVLDGSVYLVDMPLSQWGMAGKVIYTMLKLRFFNVMQQRTLHPDWNQTRPVFFMCDEYQEIVSCNRDGLSDLNFWDKSRSSKTIGIISAQSVSSFYAAIGNRDMVHALLQNFRQKIIFRSEDDWTIGYCNRLLSKVDTLHLVEGAGGGSSASLRGGSTNTSTNQTVTIQQRDVVDGQLFRNLSPDQALALLSLKGYAADDVLNVVPVFI